MEILAKALAINHYNLSLSTKNTDDSDFDTSNIRWDRIEKIFDKELIEKDIGFSRNILIVGAGASINACSKAYTTDQIVSKLYEKLSVFTMISGQQNDFSSLKEKSIEFILDNNNKTKPFAEKFFKDAFKHIHQTKDDSITLSALLKKIGFEGALKILNEFINKEDITRSIVELLNYRYIPNLFYEIVAHMFNHRFIDIIINLNFDEMLDSAIEDEMGDSDWMKITNDASCIKFGKAIVGNRLRVPLYIKPHGTISDIDSMLYSVSQYLNLSSSIRDLLEKIFDGTVSTSEEQNSFDKKIKRFNIIAAGYAFNDTDIFDFVSKNILNNYIENKKEKFITNLYIFNPNPINVLQNILKKVNDINDNNDNKKYKIFKDELDSYLQHEKLEEIVQDYKKLSNELSEKQKELSNELSEKREEFQKGLISIRTENVEKLTEDKTVLKLFVLAKEAESSRNLNKEFKKLYYEIRDHFKKPFKPTLPLRHLFICKIFNQKYLNKILEKEITTKKSQKLLQDRYKINLLFDILKFNGKVPSNVITHGRTGKYYRLYSEEFIDNKLGEKKPEYIFDLLGIDNNAKDKEVFKDDNFSINEEFLKSEKIYESFYSETEGQNNIIKNNEFYEKLAKAIGAIVEECKEKKIDEIFSDPIDEKTSFHEKIPYTGSHEVNPKYDDPEYVKFHPFDSENIINTNLSLTWHFYDFAINKLKYWNRLIMVSYSGSALINLHKHSDDPKDCNLKKIFSEGKKIELYYECEKPICFIKDKKEGKIKRRNVISAIKDIADEKEENFRNHNNKQLKNFHKMVLFLDRNENVKYGIYFFNPPNKNRINPVWFSVGDDEKDADEKDFNKKNLEIMKKYVDDLKKKDQEKKIKELEAEIAKLKERN